MLEAAFDKTVKDFGGLDIVINNAGVLNDAQWELMLNVNVVSMNEELLFETLDFRKY